MFKKPKRKTLGIGIAGVLVLCCACLGLGALTRPDTQPTATAAPRLAAVASVAVTETPDALSAKNSPRSATPELHASETPLLEPTQRAPEPTPIPTGTPELTATATPWLPLTSTPTLPPRAATGTARALQAAVRAQTVTAEAEERRDIAKATADQKELLDNWGKVDIRELDKDPDRFIGESMVFTGRVFNISVESSGTYAQMWVNSTAGQKAVVVSCDKASMDGVFENSRITVYGKGAGSFTGTNAFGGEIKQPVILCVFVIKR